MDGESINFRKEIRVSLASMAMPLREIIGNKTSAITDCKSIGPSQEVPLQNRLKQWMDLVEDSELTKYRHSFRLNE